jgi:pSer/pThr/pTyr-binding forkhead associated (FHA) protein
VIESCPRCGAKSPSGSRFCQSCGQALSSTPAPAARAATGPRPRVALRIVRADGGPEAQIAMRSDQLVCGRRGEVSLPDDPFVADSQARFFFSGQKLAVEDVGGGNGVFVRIRQERDLQPAGEVRVGRQRLLVEIIQPAAPGAGGTTMWGSPDSGARYRLVQLLEGGLRGAAFPLKDGENALGRESGDITFPGDGFVSGKHALIRVGAAGLTIRDLGSSNGTFLRLASPAFVEDGDQFLVGRQLLRVDVKAAA